MILLTNNNLIKQYYDRIADQIVEAFTKMSKKDSFDLDKNDVLISFDSYVQSIMVKAILHKRSFEVGEINYIKNIVRYFDYLSDVKVAKDVYPSKEDEELLNDLSSQYVKQIPVFATMSVLVDREIEDSIIKSDQTFSMLLYLFFEEIVNIIVDDAEESYSTILLKPIYEFFSKNQTLIKIE